VQDERATRSEIRKPFDLALIGTHLRKPNMPKWNLRMNVV
jgi:hypothetical protein